MTKIRVMLADDHPVLREGLKALIGADPRMEVVGEAGDGKSAVDTCARVLPDVLVVDINMPVMNGVQVTERVHRDQPKTKIIALSAHEERNYVHDVIRAGATGYILKRTVADELIRAVLSVHAGGTYLDPLVAQKVLSVRAVQQGRAPADPMNALSEREEQVGRLLALGYSNKEIGARMDLSVKTIETYKARLLTKLGFHSRVDIVAYGREHGWLDQ